MPEGSISTEVGKSAKAPEVKKLQKRVGPKEVKGFYYHAAEYQRQKQKERNVPHRIFRGIIEPFAIHIRAARLKHAAKKYGGEGSVVLDTQFVKQTLDKFWGKSLEEATKQQFKTKAQLHKVFERYDVKKEDVARIEEATTAVFSKVGNKEELTPDEIQAYAEQTGLSVGDIHNMISVAKENTGIYMTPNQLKGKFTEEAIFSGLSQQQQEQAKKLAHAARNSTYAALLKVPVIWLLATNPAGWTTAGLIGTNMVLSAVGRGARLHTEGKTYRISKSRGIDVSEKKKNFVGRMLTIDWEKEGREWQYARAILFGAAIGAAARFAPAALEHLGELGQHVGTDIHNALDNVGAAGHVGHEASQTFSGKSTGIQIPHVRDGELRVPSGWHFGDVHHHQNPNFLYDTHGQKVASHFFADKGGNTHFIYDKGYASSHGIDHLQQTIPLSHKETDAFNAFVNEHGTNLKIPPPSHNLPAGGHEAYGMTDYSNGNSFTIQAYDHLGDQANALEMTVNGHHLVFLPTEHVHGHPAWQFTPGDNSHMVTMWRDGQELHVTSGQAASMLHITHGELQNWVHSGYPAGVSSDFDYRVGQNILGHDLIFGHLDKSSGVLHQLGVIRGHSGLHGELTGTKFGERVYDFTAKIGQESPLREDHDEAFHSVLAGPLQWIDNAEDRLLEVFRGSVFSNSFIHRLDDISDFGLKNTDYDALAIPRLWAERPWYVGGILLPYAATGYVGYLYGKNRAEKKLTFPRAGLNTAAELALLTVLPGAAVTATIGYWIGKMRGRTKKEKAPKQPKTTVTPETVPAGQAVTSSAATDSGNLAQTTPVAPSTTSVQSTVAGGGNDASGVTPAPTLPAQAPVQQPATPENLPATAPIGEEEEPVAPPAPPVGSAVAPETQPVPSTIAAEQQGTTPPPAPPTEPTNEAVAATASTNEQPVQQQVPEVLPDTEAQTVIPETLQTVEEEKQKETEQPSGPTTGEPQQP